MASKITGIWVIRALIALVALGSLIGTITFQSGGGTRPPPKDPTPSPPVPTTIPTGALVTVPDLLGQAVASARQILVAEGLVASVGTISEEAPQLWSVVRIQDPRPGEQLPPGESVFLIATRQERPDLELPETSPGSCPATQVHPSPRFRQAITTRHAKLGSATEDGVIDLDSYPRSDEGAEVSLLWGTAGGYKGPMLVRGDRIDGDGELVFFQDPDPVESRLIPRGTSFEFHFDRGGAPNGLAWSTVVTFPDPGCYAFQIDGPNFTEHLIVEAI